MWDGKLWHASYPRETKGERIVCHLTYRRLTMRPVEDYSAHADGLIATHGGKMDNCWSATT